MLDLHQAAHVAANVAAVTITGAAMSATARLTL